MVLASVRLRQGDSAGARHIIGNFLEQMATSDHMDSDAMTAVAACTLGDVELREGRFEAAPAAFRRA